MPYRATTGCVQVAHRVFDATESTPDDHRGAQDARLLAAVEHAPINIVLTNRKGEIDFLNRGSRTTLRELQDLLPYAVGEMAAPSLQVLNAWAEPIRPVLSDPSKLPHETTLELGSNVFELLVTPTFDGRDGYRGAMITWKVATKAHERRRVTRNAAESLSVGAEELGATAHQLALTARQSSCQSVEASSRGCEASAAIERVAAAVEQLAARISGVAMRASDAEPAATSVSDALQLLHASVARLDTTSARLDGAVEAATRMGQQSELIAHNAMVEGARLGPAGRGVEVVAKEVRHIARASRALADDIGRKREAAKVEADRAVASIVLLSERIDVLRTIQADVACASEVQAAAAQGVAHGASSAAEVSRELVVGLQTVAREAVSTSSRARAVGAVAQGLARFATRLHDLVHLEPQA